MMFALMCLAVLVVAPFAREALRKPMDATARQAAPGAFAKLSQGLTHYQWYGPDKGPVVVCVHGLTTPSFVWRSIASALADQGFRVLTYDLYGRGFSDRPAGPQSSAFFNQQLSELLADQQVTQEVALVGYSMGGAIVTGFAAQGSHPIKRMVLIAPAGMRSVGEGLLQRMAHLPLVSQWLMLGLYPLLLSKGLHAEADGPTSVPGINALQRGEMKVRGFFPAVHQSVVGMLTDKFETHHNALRDKGLPIMAIWGADDEIIPLSAMDTLAAWNPDVAHHVVAGAGHGVTYSHTAKVLEQLVPFLDGTP